MFKSLFALYKTNKQFRFTVGLLLLFISFFFFFSFISYLFVGQADQSIIQDLGNFSLAGANENVRNWLGLIGAMTAYFFIYKGIGFSVVLFVPLLFCKAWYILSGQRLCHVRRFFYFNLFITFMD